LLSQNTLLALKQAKIRKKNNGEQEIVLDQLETNCTDEDTSLRLGQYQCT